MATLSYMAEWKQHLVIWLVALVLLVFFLALMTMTGCTKVTGGTALTTDTANSGTVTIPGGPDIVWRTASVVGATTQPSASGLFDKVAIDLGGGEAGVLGNSSFKLTSSSSWSRWLIGGLMILIGGALGYFGGNIKVVGALIGGGVAMIFCPLWVFVLVTVIVIGVLVYEAYTKDMHLQGTVAGVKKLLSAIPEESQDAAKMIITSEQNISTQQATKAIANKKAVSKSPVKLSMPTA